MFLRASLATCLIAAAFLSAASSASGQDQTNAIAASGGMDGCVRYVARQAMVVRCALAEPQVLSDHGMTADEPYDAQGNLLDRHGDVVAVPEGRGQPAREVFAGDRGMLR